jgi:hypothetical protein
VLARYVTSNAPWEWVSGLFLYGVLAGVAHGAVMHRLLGEREARRRGPSYTRCGPNSTRTFS